MFTSEDIIVLNDTQGAEGCLLDKINEYRGIALDNIDPNGIITCCMLMVV